MKRILILLITTLGMVCARAQTRHPESVRIDTLHIGSATCILYDTLYVAPGKPAPDFEVIREDGTHIRSSELRGKTVLLNFWITTCGPCRRELKRVRSEILDRFENEAFVFLSVGANETAESTARFRESTGVNFPLCYDPGKAAFSLFSSSGCPRNYIIDPEGRIVLAEEGYNDEKFKKLIQTLSETIRGTEQ